MKIGKQLFTLLFATAIGRLVVRRTTRSAVKPEYPVQVSEGEHLGISYRIMHGGQSRYYAEIHVPEKGWTELKNHQVFPTSTEAQDHVVVEIAATTVA